MKARTTITDPPWGLPTTYPRQWDGTRPGHKRWSSAKEWEKAPASMSLQGLPSAST